MFQVKKFENGLKLAVCEMPWMASASIGIWVGVGGRYETVETAGLSHFLEHMLFKGTHTRSCQQIKEEIEGVGGMFNAFTSEEFTCYYAKIIGAEYQNTLEVLADMVLDPLFQPKDIEQEKGVVLEEIKMYRDLPGCYVHDLLAEVLWPKQPLGMFLIGNEKNVLSFDQERCFAYKDKFYAPNNIVVACAGKVNYNEVVECVQRLFGGLASREVEKYQTVSCCQKKPELRVFCKDTEQMHLAFGIKAYSRYHEDRYVVGLLNVILGGNTSSRFFNEVREKRGLAYEIKSSVSKYYDVGVFDVSVGVENKKLLEAVKVIMEVLNKIKYEKVSLDEFNRAKKYYIGSFLMQLEKTTDKMLWTGENTMVSKKVSSEESIMERIEKIGPEDIQRVANDLLQNEKLNLAVIGPVKEEVKAQLKDSLKF
jgi:predicted Zn-dependent peptidase